MHVSGFVEITSTRQRVFAFLQNPEKAMLWQTSVTSAEIEHATPDLVGTTGRETVSDGTGSLEMQTTVTRVDPDRLIRFHVESRVNAVDVEYRLESDGQSVRLTQNAEIRWKFPLSVLMLFMGARTQRGITDQMRTELGNLKRLCEVASTAA
jgi:uncharacterized protein YndB with AHSA1/START domain